MKEGWHEKKLSEVADLNGRIGWKGLTAKEYTETGPYFLSVHSLNYGDYVDFRDAFHISQKRYDESPEIMLRKDDILICKDGAGIGKLGIIGELPGQSTVNSSLLVIRRRESILTKYLYYSLLSPFFQKIVQERLQGATTPHLYQRDIKTFPIYLAPLPEQKQIVTLLDQAFAAIDQAKANVEKNLQNAKELFQSKLNEVFEGKGDRIKIVKLNEICEVKDGTHDSPKYVDKENGIPFVTQKNILETGLSFEKTKFIKQEDHDHFYKRSNVAFNDIIFSMIGANRGMACIVDDKRAFSIKNVGLIKSSENYRPKYLLYYLKSPVAKNYVSNNSSGSAQGFIGLGKLRAFPFPLVDLNKQETIERQLETLNKSCIELENKFSDKLLALEQLKKSILQKAFSGEFTSAGSVTKAAEKVL